MAFASHVSKVLCNVDTLIMDDLIIKPCRMDTHQTHASHGNILLVVSASRCWVNMQNRYLKLSLLIVIVIYVELLDC